jgi:predicted transcriptional regulator
MSAKDGKCEDLPPVAAQARRFDKARSAQSHARMEDYAELISDLIAAQGEARPTDIARRLGVSHATAIKFLARMKQAGLVTSQPYRGVFLTQAGAIASWSIFSSPSACRGRWRRSTPRAWSIMSPTRRSRPSRGFSRKPDRAPWRVRNTAT